MAPATHSGLRRSHRIVKQHPLFLGLIAIPTKTKTLQKSRTTPKALKLAIAAAGLTESLAQEAVDRDPLQEETIQHIKQLVSLPTTKGMTQTPPVHSANFCCTKHTRCPTPPSSDPLPHATKNTLELQPALSTKDHVRSTAH
jgi:hypothetical protein